MKLTCINIFFLSLSIILPVKAEDAAFEQWKRDFAQLAVEQNISQEIVKEYVPYLKRLDRVIALDRKQPEFKLTFSSYIKRTITPDRILKGQTLYKKKKKLFNEIEQKYHVPSAYLIAFWGIETHYGNIKGNIDTLDALATLSYDNRRSTFFTQQLIALLKIIQKDRIIPPQGSWAGAFGHFQFMPTTYLHYAVDGDNDGRRDLVMSFPDAIASAANYLSQMGWNPRIRWGREVKGPLSESFYREDGEKTLKEWYEMGLRLKGKDSLTDFEKSITARLMMPSGKKGPAFLVYSNFDVIKRWNRSDYYALSIGILADYIAGIETFNITKLPEEKSLCKDEIKKIQKKLTIDGYYSGSIDGLYGEQTKEALKQYQKNNNLVPDGYLSKELLEKILK